MSSFNKMSAIKIGGVYTNTIASGVGSIGNVSLDISGNSYLRNKLWVDGDVSLNNAYISNGLTIPNINTTAGLNTNIGSATGNTNIIGVGTFANTYTTPTRTLKIGADLVNYTLTHNTGQAPITGNVWTPTRINIPANNCYDYIEFSIPFDLSVRKNGAGSVGPGVLTITYNSITFTISKNGSPRTITNESYELVDFTAGGSRTWGTTAFATSDSNYFWSYWGYFKFNIPIDTWNTTADYYDVSITMNATASHANGGVWDVRSLGLGQTITAGGSGAFTQTRSHFASQQPTYPFYPAYVAPYVISTNTVLNGMTIASPNSLYVSNNGDATYYAQNSLLFKSGTGFWTAQSSSNYYYQSPTNSYSVIYGDQAGNQFLNFEFAPGGSSISSITNTLNFQSDDSINFNANSGDITLNTQNCYIDTTNETTINSASVIITTTNDININNKNLLYSPPEFTSLATVNITFPLESIYMITSTTASSRDYILPTATSAHAGAIFRLVNTVPRNTVDYTISIKTTGTQYLTLGGGDETLNLQTYQLQMDEASVEFVYNGSDYWLCLSQRPTIPTGTIISYPININTTRYGLQNRFVLCDGASLNATANPRFFNLWKVIGTTFGGSGVSAFNTPNLQGTVLKGAGSKTVSQASNSNAGGTINVAHTATISAFQNDATLVIKQSGWYSNSGSGDQSRSRNRIAGDGVESNPGNDTSIYVDRYAEEVRVYNMGVNWYMKL